MRVLIVLVAFLIGAYGQDSSFSCDFESDVTPFCGMDIGGTDSNLLTRRSDATPSEQTGPDAPQSGQNYVHLEASGSQSTDYVELTKTNLEISSGCLSFYYHMFDDGSGDVNSMTVETNSQNNGGSWTSEFQQQGNQGNQWILVRQDVSNVRRLRFTLYSNGQYRGDIGLDNINLVSGSCSNQAGQQQQAPVPAPTPPPAVRPGPGPGPPQPVRPPRPGPPMPGRPGPPLPAVSMSAGASCAIKPGQQEGYSWAQCEKFMTPFTVILAGGQNSSYGRVEVYYNQTWGTICRHGLDEEEAQAICKSAGFYGGEILENVPQNMRLQRNDPRRIWLDGVRCYKGSNLQDCGRNELGVTDCNHDDDVFVKCDIVPEYCERMNVNETDMAEDSCMMDDDDRRSRDRDRPRDSRDRSYDRERSRDRDGWGMMGYGRDRREERREREREREREEKMKMKKCMKSSPFAVALLDGSSPAVGRVEVYVNDTWGTVCSDDFGAKEAEAVCKSMGLFGGRIWRNPPQTSRLDRNDPRRIWLDGVRCGEDASLRECCRNEWGVTDCTHDQDVFVRCEMMPTECRRMKEERESQCRREGRGREEDRERPREGRGRGRDDMESRRDDGFEFPSDVNDIFQMLMGEFGMGGMGTQRERERGRERDDRRERRRDFEGFLNF